MCKQTHFGLNMTVYIQKWPLKFGQGHNMPKCSIQANLFHEISRMYSHAKDDANRIWTKNNAPPPSLRLVYMG